MKEVGVAVLSMCSFGAWAPAPISPDNFWDVMNEWGYGWLWENIQLIGSTDWLASSIKDGSCAGLGVADGSYMRDIHPSFCSAAFFFENGDRSCKLVGSFAETSLIANAYRGELLGLMAMHLILLAVNKVNPERITEIFKYILWAHWAIGNLSVTKESCDEDCTPSVRR